jgi:hypothetical protein
VAPVTTGIEGYIFGTVATDRGIKGISFFAIINEIYQEIYKFPVPRRSGI